MTQPQAHANGTPPNSDFDAVIVGAGFAGLYMLHRLRGMGLKARVLEAGSGVGGTWYWNRYPGARCDVESVQYSFQFSDALQQEWDWSERYAAQPELLRYANHVADRFDLRRDIQFNTRVNARVRSTRRPGAGCIETGDGARITATYCIMATGCLSSPNLPVVRGARDLPGRALPHRLLAARGGRLHGQAGGRDRHRLLGRAVDPHHRRPGQAAHRVPAHGQLRHPRAQCRRSTPEYRSARSRPTIRPCARARGKNMTGIDFDYSDAAALETPPEERTREYERRWQRGGLSFLGAYKDLMVDQEANDTAADFVRGKIRGKVRRSEAGRAAGAEEHHRLQAAVHRHRLLRDLQPPERDAGRRERERRIEAITPAGRAGAGPGIPGRRHRVRHRLRRHDRGAAEDRHPRPRRPGAAREVARGAAHLPRAGHGRLPQPVHGHRPRQSLGADQHAAHHRAARRLDRRHLGLSARPRPRPHRGQRAGRGRTGSPTSASWPAARCATPAAPGTSASTSPASRACSCPTSAASRATSRSARRWPGEGTRGLWWRENSAAAMRPRADSCTAATNVNGLSSYTVPPPMEPCLLLSWVGGSCPKRVKAPASPCHQRRLAVNWGCLSLDPVTRYFHTAPDALGCDR